MIYGTSFTAVAVFGFFVAIVLGISFYLGANAKTASGYSPAHGGIAWFLHGIAFAGDLLTAGMVSTTWVQFIKVSLLVIFCAMLVIAILARGLVKAESAWAGPVALPTDRAAIPPTGAWVGKPYARYPRPEGGYELFRIDG